MNSHAVDRSAVLRLRARTRNRNAGGASPGRYEELGALGQRHHGPAEISRGRLRRCVICKPSHSALADTPCPPGFWSSQRLGKVISPVTAQLALAPKLGDARIRTALIPLIAVLSPKVSQHDALLKILNASVLRHVRSDELRVKRSAIEALDAMWRELGAALVPLVPETVGTGLAEALEEPEGGVEAAARKLLTRIEGELGGESIDSYLA